MFLYGDLDLSPVSPVKCRYPNPTFIKVIMTTQRLKKIAAFASFGVGGFVTGAYFARATPTHEAPIRNYPGLPIFGTVSAASPISSVPAESNAGRISQIMKYGFPSLDNIRSFDNYVLSYDKRNRVAHWVFEHITPESAKFNDQVDRALSEFKPDESIHPYFRAQNSDYYKSGYDRGHMAAAGNHRISQKSVDQTFFLSNMAPQVGKGFNRDAWNKLERYVRKLTKTYKNVFCCTGPLYLPRPESDGKNYIKYEVIGANHVAVPTHFFKIIVCESHDGQFEMESYVMPNQPISDDIPLINFRVPPETVERASGLLFFDNLTRSKIGKINGKKN